MTSSAHFTHRVKQARPAPGATWHLDEVFVNVGGEPYLPVAPSTSMVPFDDPLLQKRRDWRQPSASSSVRWPNIQMAHVRSSPTSYAAIRRRKVEIPELAGRVKHVSSHVTQQPPE